MAKEAKWQRRANKQYKERYGLVVNSKSVFLIQQIQNKRKEKLENVNIQQK